MPVTCNDATTTESRYTAAPAGDVRRATTRRSELPLPSARRRRRPAAGKRIIGSIALHIVSHYGHCGPTVAVAPCLVHNVRGTATPGAGAQSAQRAQRRSSHPWSRMRYGQVCSQTTIRKSGACAGESRCWSQDRQRRPEARAPRRLHTHFIIRTAGRVTCSARITCSSRAAFDSPHACATRRRRHIADGQRDA